MRVVLDTNLIVSWVLTPRGVAARILDHWRAGDFELLVSEAIVSEYGRALSYGKIRTRTKLSDDETEELVSGLRQFALLVRPQKQLRVVKADPDDDKFFECGVAGAAAYIVSRDKKVLAVKTYRGIRVVTPEVFLVVLEGRR